MRRTCLLEPVLHDRGLLERPEPRSASLTEQFGQSAWQPVSEEDLSSRELLQRCSLFRYNGLSDCELLERPPVSWLHGDRELLERPTLLRADFQGERTSLHRPPLPHLGLQKERGLLERPPLPQSGLQNERGLMERPSLSHSDLRNKRSLLERPPLLHSDLQWASAQRAALDFQQIKSCTSEVSFLTCKRFMFLIVDKFHRSLRLICLILLIPGAISSDISI